MTPTFTIERNDDGTFAAGYLRIRADGDDGVRTEQVIPGVVNIDYDKDDRILGVEVLQLSVVEAGGGPDGAQP